jgi:predicted nucleotide-binding protein
MMAKQNNESERKIEQYQTAATESILARFEGSIGRHRLVELLRAQAVLCCDTKAIGKIAKVATVREFEPGEILIRQGAASTEVFFVLSGVVRIRLNGRAVADRRAGQHIGEMASIDPTGRRSSTVIASEHTIVAQVEAPVFLKLADKNPRIWQAISVELCRRLDERRKFHFQPNSKPIVFIGSSRESLAVAQAFREAISRDIAEVTLWTHGVFAASSFPIDDLEAQLGIADFAVLVAAADDRVISRGAEADAPRDNVILELGLFMGELSRHRTFLLAPRGVNLKIPTDLLGLTPLCYERVDGPDANHSLAVAEAAAGLARIIEEKGAR